MPIKGEVGVVLEGLKPRKVIWIVCPVCGEGRWQRPGRTKSDIVKESINLYLWEARFRRLQKRVGTKAKKAGMVSEEDVFKAIS